MIHLDESEITIKVFETGGGDPAMNGNVLIVNICEWDIADGECFAWETGINIYKIKSVSAKNNKCIIECTEHQMEEETGLIKTASMKYFISYYFDKSGHLKNTITVEKVKI